MVKQQVEIINKLGLHARAAAKLVTTATNFACSIQVTKDGRSVDGKSIMSVMMLAASKGCCIIIQCDGEDENDALESLCRLVNNRFDEEE
ncbi:phosphocarrier protein [Sinobacterium caligoides]|uniref:Phosphocarrier protein n=1 Tax=Sinobacterium caligoides TaxID=933926 RepID=A0A3N2E1X2_9GAMM|nr:HPr family phosphocarrier protein [Sinobacterium caligoides]ROS06118.1 phosphocarrier protein [Sinobacterium caligoides]